MAKDKITEYDATAANNTVVGDVNLAENSALPSDMNNAVREVMSHQKEAFGSGTPLYVDQTNNRVGVGNSAPSTALEVDADGATVLTVDRATDNGAVIDIQKDGTSVGSVQSRGGAVTSVIFDPRSNGAGMTGTTNAIMPTNQAGAIGDGTAVVDLGASGHRYRDIFLSGNIYLGGTGTANALNDYEEGTCTITATAATTAPTSPVSVTAFYTKIGNSVTVWCEINNITMAGAAGNMRFTGLPFGASGNAGNKPGVAYVNNLVHQASAERATLVETSGAGNTHLNFRITRSDNNAATLIAATSGHIQNGTTDVRFCITYKVN